MNKVLKMVGISLLVLLLGLLVFGLYLNRGLPHEIKPAQFQCLDLKDGYFTTFDTLPENIYGIGLAYAGHINETASSFDPQADPPVFKKAVSSLTGNGSQVKVPTHTELVDAIEELETGLRSQIEQLEKPLPVLFDYEAEMGFVLLEDVPFDALNKSNYVPKIGFYIANDLSSRSLAILGEGQSNRYDYWGVSKSFAGFTPISEQVWIPSTFQANAIPCIMLETKVNGEVRQQQMTNNLIYTPLQMLQAIHRKYPNTELKKGDLILTGTPGGVIMSAPRWLVRLAGIIGMGRFEKLANVTDEENVARFLKKGDKVTTSGKGLGQVEVELIE